jgi:hypothetical protein
MRIVTLHEDGHGLNELIEIRPDPESYEYGAAHRYDFVFHKSDGPVAIGFLQFQKGPRTETGSTCGLTEAAVIASCIDRVKGFQSGPFACEENERVIAGLEEALRWTRARADERARRGVLGRAAL